MNQNIQTIAWLAATILIKTKVLARTIFVSVKSIRETINTSPTFRVNTNNKWCWYKKTQCRSGNAFEGREAHQYYFQKGVCLRTGQSPLSGFGAFVPHIFIIFNLYCLGVTSLIWRSFMIIKANLLATWIIVFFSFLKVILCPLISSVDNVNTISV